MKLTGSDERRGVCIVGSSNEVRVTGNPQSAGTLRHTQGTGALVRDQESDEGKGQNEDEGNSPAERQYQPSSSVQTGMSLQSHLDGAWELIS